MSERNSRRPVSRARRRTLLAVAVWAGLVVPPFAGAAEPSGAGDPIREEGKRVSPRGAVLRSAVLPGWGQLSTGHPWKAGLMFAAATGLGVGIGLETRNVNTETDLARAAETEQEFEIHRLRREDHLASRRTFVSWLLFLWSYNLLDAYVEGHFQGFGGLELREAAARPDPPPGGEARETGDRIAVVRVGFAW